MSGEAPSTRNEPLSEDAVPAAADGSAVTRLGPTPSPIDRYASTPRPPRAVPPPDDPDAAPVPTVAGYDILAKLGQGGMGVVYKAHQVTLKRVVALKMIKAGAHADAEDLARFRIEAEAVAQFRHPNIVQIYEVGEQDRLPYFSLEFVDGGSLADRLDGTPQPWRAAAELVQTLARTMHAAHEQQIVHRDLKPANVLLTADGQPKITDFGLAKRLDAPAAGQTQSGVIVGTPTYMAPEQAAGHARTISPAIDIHALGVILYELLTGRPPFQAAVVLDLLEQVRTQEPVPPRRLQPKVPRDLETICLKCLQKEPRKRYASARALADDVGRFLRGEPILARPTSAWERGVKWVQRRPAAAAFLAACTVAVASLVAAALLYQHLQFRERERDLREQAQAAVQRAALEVQRSQVQQLLRQGQEALAAGNRGEARNWLIEAQARCDREPLLAKEKAGAERLLAQLDRYQRFQAHYHDALFHAAQPTGLDRLTHLQATREAAGKGLACFGLEAQTPTAPALDVSPFSAGEQEEIRTACFELLLLLAEAEAQPLGPEEQPHTQADQALATLERARQVLGWQTRAYHWQRAQVLAQRHGEAAAADERRRAADPALPATLAVDHFLLGKLRMTDERSGPADLAEALEHFERTLQAQPQHFWARYCMALCQLRSQRPGQRELPLELAKANILACIGLKPDLAWNYVVKGMVHGELGEVEAAEAAYARAEEGLKGNTDGRYILLVNRGVLRVRQRQRAAAIADFQEARGLKPAEVMAHLNLAQVYQEQRQLNEAAGHLQEVIRLRPHWALPYYERGRLHRLRANPEAALGDFKTAIELEPPGSKSPVLARTQAWRGALLYEQKRYPEAVTAWEAALQIDAQDPGVLRLLADALLRLAETEDDDKKRHQHYERAIAVLDRFLEHRQDQQSYRTRGRIKGKLEDLQGLLADYTQALQLQGDSALFADRGWAYLAKEVPGVALPDFQKAIDLDPKNWDAYAGRGQALVRLGHYREAVRDADAAVRGAAPESALLCYKAARVFAAAVGAVEADPRQQNAQGLATLYRYQDRALTLLRRALDPELTEDPRRFWRTYVQRDPALQALRRSLEFRRLEERYAQRSR
jgi:tetratricopeptide (TPR) repeat protein